MTHALHASGIAMALRCGLQFQYRYLDGIIKPPGVALLVGSTVHKAAEHNLLAKRDAGSPLPQQHVEDLAALEFDRQWSSAGEVALSADERAAGSAAVRGDAKDEAIRLSALHGAVLIPELDPLHVERSVRVNVSGLRFELEGTFDLVTRDGTIHDLKTSGKKLDADSITDSVQMRMYDMLYSVENREKPAGLALDVLQKTRKPQAYVVRSPRFESHVPILDMAARVETMVEKGVFAPAAPDSWACSSDYCGYYAECPFGARARKTVSFGGSST